MLDMGLGNIGFYQSHDYYYSRQCKLNIVDLWEHLLFHYQAFVRWWSLIYLDRIFLFINTGLLKWNI